MEAAKSQPSITIPVIDLSMANSPSDRPNVIDQVKHAAKEWGFFQVINHGIPTSLQNDTVEAIKAFISLPAAAKSQYSANPAASVTYAANRDFPSAGADDTCCRETVMVLAGTAPPPEEDIPEEIRREYVEWVPRAVGVAESVMELLAEGLGLEKGRFKELSLLGVQVFLGHCYPRCAEPDRTVGIKSHTDGGILTVLMQNQVPGLQVMHEIYGWVDVKPVIGSLIVNIGDLLQIVSNDEYKSVQHRVLANPLKESRISIAMVFNPSKWINGCLGPLPELLSPEKPAIFRSFTQQEIFDTYRGKAIGNKSLVDRVKI